MQGRLFMQGTDGNTASMELTKLPEFIPPEPTEAEKKELAFDFHQEITIQCGSLTMRAPNGHRKELECISRFGIWTARGPIRMQMMKKAAMQEKRFIHKHHAWVDDKNNLLWYRRGDGALMKFRIISKEEGA